MAARPHHMNDGGIAERRLRPIYDWLDNGNHKKALQEADKVLKKCPSLPSARALKALALLRLGKNDEAHSVLDLLAGEKPHDDTTLQAMTICYRECHQLHKVSKLYAEAVKMEPTSEELHSHLFMSHVRTGDHRAQQLSAMALYKFAPKNPYYFWAVMSIVLQAKSSDDTTKRNILLALAQRMVDNFIAENKMEAEQEARLYIMILELQEKWEDILKFMEGPLYARLVPGAMPQACMPYLRKLGLWRRLNVFCKELLLDNQDRWDFFMPYFDSAFQLMKGEADPGDGTLQPDDTAEKCHEFIALLVESMGRKPMRGPYLARLELWRRLKESGESTEPLGCGLALCVQYLRVFAHKPCAVPDLRPYLGMLPQEQRESGARDFLTCLGFHEDSEPDTQDDIQRHVSCLAAWRLTAPPLPPAEGLQFANKLRSHYLRCVRAGFVISTVTEFCAADAYALLAAHCYFDAALEMEDSKPIMDALCLLELALHKSPANFHIKLLLIRLYHILGNALAADQVYQRLEVKHVQLISLGWLHAARLAPALAGGRALRLLGETAAFYTHHAKDSVEHLTYAYKYGTFEKLVELIAWAARLGGCQWHGGCARERELLSLLCGPPRPLHAPPPPPHPPTDNRDLEVIVDYNPPQFRRPDLKARTFAEETDYLRLKDNLVSSIALCIELSDGRPAEAKRGQCEELREAVAALEVMMARGRERYRLREKATISAPFPCRIIAFVNSPVPYRELYSATFGLVPALSQRQWAGVQAGCALLAPLLQRSLAVHRGETDALFAHKDGQWPVRDALEAMHNYLEFLGILTYILGVCNELVAPAQARKAKKRAQSPDELRTSEALSKLNQALQATIVSLDDALLRWPAYTSQGSLEDAMAALSIHNQVGEDKYVCPVEARLNSTRTELIGDVSETLKKKVKYLKSLVQP